MSGLGALPALGLGFGLGAVAGMPLGVINIAIVDAATAGRRRFAEGLGLGGAAADAIHAALAFAGVGRVMTADPAVVRGLAIGAAVAIIAYAVIAWRRRERAGDPQTGPQTGDAAPRMRGAAAGFVLTLPNPGALGAWVFVAAAVWRDAAPRDAAVIAGGVCAGSALWFTTLARWVSRWHRAHPEATTRSRTLELFPRVALVVLIAIAIAGVVRSL